ncbi:Short-chain dehydrogenase [uncultured Thiomicrorhabdus sp.]
MQQTDRTHPSAAQRIWLIGASQGIGLQLSKLLLEQGFHLVASARQASSNYELLELQENYPQHLALLDCDISGRDLGDVCKRAWQIYDGLDIWFYNVGGYQPMRIDEWDLAAFEMMNQANYLGAVKVMLPLRKLQQQHNIAMRWLWNISLAADFGLPYGGGYSAPKAALLNLAESLQPELATRQIDLQIINHGFVKTRLTAKNQFPMPGLMEPQQAAQRIMRLLVNRPQRFELRFPFGLNLLLATLKRLPKRLSLTITQKML